MSSMTWTFLGAPADSVLAAAVPSDRPTGCESSGSRLVSARVDAGTCRAGSRERT